MKKFLILFDIDGTILKFKHYLAKKLFSELLQELFNKEIPENAIPDFHGMTDLQILKIISDNIGFPFSETEKLLPDIWNKMLAVFDIHSVEDNIELLPGVNQLINDLHKHPDVALGLLTGNFQDNAYLKLRAVKLDSYFDFGAFGNDSIDRNDLPIIAINRANDYYQKDYFSNINTIIIGDTHRDEECARVNNIKCICVCTGNQNYEELKSLNPDALFHNLSDTELIKKTIFELLNEKNHNSN